MKTRKTFITLAIALALVCGMVIGANAADTLKEISAYLNYGITIKYNGEVQNLTDAGGNRVYPISYNGTTYLPVRAVGNMLGIGVEWDQATQTILLGEKADGTDLIDNFKPYNSYTTSIDYRGSLDPEFIQSSEKQTTTIGGVSVTGGRGRVTSAIVGVTVFELLKLALQYLGMDANAQWIAIGIVIFIAISLDIRKYIAKK